MKNDIRFVNLSSYTTPEIKEVKNREWVDYGADNNYYQYLIDRYNGSPTNNACINGISQLIFGEGIDATNSSKKPQEYAEMRKLLNKDCIYKLSYDLKLLGQASMQVIYAPGKTKVIGVEHFPIQTLRAEKANEDGDIEGYYYHPDWSKLKPSEDPKRIPAFGTSNETIEILCIKPYRSGYFYYSPVDYQGGIQYAELEEEISNYHLNNILNGLAPSMLINFNNGVPDEEERQIIEQRIYQKFSGSSNAGKFILSFNDNSEAQSSIEPVQLSDAHNQYQFLSDESMRKIMVAHRIVSPMLLGIKDQTGLGNNAEELKTASNLMDNTVIRPFQNLLIEAFNQILAFNNISLDLYFKTLQPLEFTDLDNAITKEQVEEETGQKLAKEIDGRTAYETIEEAEAKAKEMGCEGYHEHIENGKKYYMPCETHDLADEEFDIILDSLRGETISNRWEAVDERELNEENDNHEEWASKLIMDKQENLEEVTSKPSGFSYLDKSLYKIRYKYAEKYSSGKSRQFCRIMMARSNRGVVYRLEDIDKASREGVNKSFGHKGKAYDLFKYKGGVNCGHTWVEVLYRLKAKTKKSQNIDDYTQVASIPKTYKPSPRGSADAKKAPKDMANNGHHPNYKK